MMAVFLSSTVCHSIAATVIAINFVKTLHGSAGPTSDAMGGDEKCAAKIDIE
jgi:hypothetical protein